MPQLLNYNSYSYESIHFWIGNESENLFLISNFTKNYDFFFLNGKTTLFWLKTFLGQLTKHNFELRMLKLLENHVIKVQKGFSQFFGEGLIF